MQCFFIIMLGYPYCVGPDFFIITLGQIDYFALLFLLYSSVILTVVPCFFYYNARLSLQLHPALLIVTLDPSYCCAMLFLLKHWAILTVVPCYFYIITFGHPL